MPPSSGRYPAAVQPGVAAGWTLERLTPPSALFGAAGMRVGPDGRLYVAQVSGSQISAIDLATGLVEAVSPLGGAIVAPDDLVFDAAGNLYATEVMDARVSIRAPDGTTRILRDDLPSANGITLHQGRLFVDECRPGGRLLELDLAGGAPRVLLEDLPMPNALEMGQDGKLYFPVMAANAIWRIDPDGGGVETVIGDLGVPDAVKFDAQGRIVSTQVASGEVLRIDPHAGTRETIATIAPGLDNLVWADDRLLVSDFTGRITEVLAGGATREVLAGGLNGPFDLAVGGDGQLYVADGPHMYVLPAGGALRSVGMLFTPGSPGYVRGLTAHPAGGFVVTTSAGQVSHYRPDAGESAVLADGLDQLYGVAVAPGGDIVVAEYGAGRVLAIGAGGDVTELATGLDRPTGIAIGADGTRYVSEAGAGRIAKIARGGAETVVDGLHRPHGIAVMDGLLYVADPATRTLSEHDPERGTRRIVAHGLPIGPPPGVTPRPLRGIPPFSGPMGPYAGLACDGAGNLYISADGDGSVIALRRAA